MPWNWIDSADISVKEFNKIRKYKDLERENEKMCHLKTSAVPVIVGTLGMIKKETDKHETRYLAVPAYTKGPKNCTLRNYSSP